MAEPPAQAAANSSSKQESRRLFVSGLINSSYLPIKLQAESAQGPRHSHSHTAPTVLMHPCQSCVPIHQLAPGLTP